MGLLQVGLEQEADVAVGGVALGDTFGQYAEPGRLLAHPALVGSFEHRLGDPLLAADHPAVEEPEGDAQVLGRHVEGLGRLADTVVERDALVPHRVPDAVGGGGDVLAVLVEEDHVEVAEGTELAPAVAADGHQRHASGVAAARLVEEPGQPLVGRGRIRPAESVATEVGTVDQLLASDTQGHRRTVAPCCRRTATRRRYAGGMADDSDSGSGRSTLSTVVLVVGVVVVVWFLLGILHFLVSLVWGVVEVAGLVALVLVIGWLLFRNKGD